MTPSRRNWGETHAIIPTTAIVPTPPKITAPTGPNNDAATPDSKPPNSFDAPIKTALTAPTRPRISSGVYVIISVCRMTTLMLSNAPNSASIATDNQKDVDKPNTIVATPNPATASSSVCPDF